VRQLLAPHEVDLDPRTPNGLTYAEALLRLGHPEQARVMFAARCCSRRRTPIRA
jgi:hypothetical protein